MKYTLRKIVGVACSDMVDGVSYICEAFDDNNEIVIVKMTEEEVENGESKDD